MYGTIYTTQSITLLVWLLPLCPALHGDIRLNSLGMIINRPDPARNVFRLNDVMCGACRVTVLFLVFHVIVMEKPVSQMRFKYREKGRETRTGSDPQRFLPSFVSSPKLCQLQPRCPPCFDQWISWCDDAGLIQWDQCETRNMGSQTYQPCEANQKLEGQRDAGVANEITREVGNVRKLAVLDKRRLNLQNVRLRRIKTGRVAYFCLHRVLECG